MVRAWYMDDSPDDQRLEHQLNPPQSVSLEDLAKNTGVMYYKVKKHFHVLPCGCSCIVRTTTCVCLSIHLY